MHTKGKWDCEPNGDVLEIYAMLTGEVITSGAELTTDNAEYICKCVNNFERMKSALEGAEHIFRDLSYPKTADTIENILKDIDND